MTYDPTEGTVTGNGRALSSPEAKFGFGSRYQSPRATTADHTPLGFRSGGFAFESTGYEWRVVGGTGAQFKGNGVVNGTIGFSFMLTAVDGVVANCGNSDRFRLKVWNTTTGVVVCDNQTTA